MDSMFQQHHPKDSLMLGRGLFSNFFALLKKEFPMYLDPVLLLVTKIFTRFRQRAINYRAKMAKKNKNAERKTFAQKKAAKEQARLGKKARICTPDSLRGKRKLNELKQNR